MGVSKKKSGKWADYGHGPVEPSAILHTEKDHQDWYKPNNAGKQGSRPSVKRDSKKPARKSK